MKERPLTYYARLSVVAAVVTFALKLAAWRLTGSVGLLSDALESVVNLAAAFVALGSLAVAARPADDEHAFGHSKAEYFAAGTEGALILVAAAAIAWSAVERFFSPQPLSEPAAGLAISAVASCVNFAVARVLLRVGRKRNSIALEADAKHLLTDVWTSVAVIPAVALVAFTGWLWLDPLIGILIALHIVATGVTLVRESMLGLMDTGLPVPQLEIIRTTLSKYAEEGVQYHALLTRRAAARQFMSVHLLMPGNWTITRGHDLAEIIERDLRKAIPGLIVLTHLEPDDDPVSWHDVELERKDAHES
ncbi:MAG: cation diffusion facilitator family transporter [Chthoniobacteraceae bacterium]